MIYAVYKSEGGKYCRSARFARSQRPRKIRLTQTEALAPNIRKSDPYKLKTVIDCSIVIN